MNFISLYQSDIGGALTLTLQRDLSARADLLVFRYFLYMLMLQKISRSIKYFSSI